MNRFKEYGYVLAMLCLVATMVAWLAPGQYRSPLDPPPQADPVTSYDLQFDYPDGVSISLGTRSYEARLYAESRRMIQGTMPTSDFSSLVTELEKAHFWALPADWRGDYRIRIVTPSRAHTVSVDDGMAELRALMHRGVLQSIRQRLLAVKSTSRPAGFKPGLPGRHEPCMLTPSELAAAAVLQSIISSYKSLDLEIFPQGTVTPR